MKLIESQGQFVGIRPSSRKIIKVYALNGHFAELHFQKRLGLILDIRYVSHVENLITLISGKADPLYGCITFSEHSHHVNVYC